MYIYDKVNELAGLLKDSDQYRTYRAYADKIDANPADTAMVKEYKKLRFEVQSAYMAGETPDQEKLDKLAKLGEVLQFNTDITQFLSAEYSLNQLMGDVYRILGEAVDLDLSFLRD